MSVKTETAEALNKVTGGTLQSKYAAKADLLLTSSLTAGMSDASDLREVADLYIALARATS